MESAATADTHTTLREIISFLDNAGSEENRKGMARFGINTGNAFGVKIPVIRELAIKLGRNHALALALWDSGYHEARILAGYLADPEQVTPELMDAWVADFDSWDLCDQICSSLFRNTDHAVLKAFEWADCEEEYICRAGFVMMANFNLGLQRGKYDDSVYESCFEYIVYYATDERNFVMKAINWALRQIGKSSRKYYNRAVEVAEILSKSDSKPARWIGHDALRELRKESTIARLK
ncbi:MAG: DNA alkylation repair protein [Bacteroidota bacterium]